MKKSDFDSLLDRYLKGRATHAEKIKIEAWLDSRQSKDERQSIWTQEEEAVLFQKITSSIKEGSTSRHESIQPRLFGLAWKIAASVVLLMTAGWIGFSVLYPSPQPLSVTTARQPQKVILADGTIVWLQPQTTFTYDGPNSAGERSASLSGEAVFEVAKDPQHPFVIRCSGRSVKVLGTSFHLKTDETGFAIDVFTGKVNVFSEIDKTGMTALAKERIAAEPGHRTERENFEPERIQTLLAQTEYDMHFSNTSLEQVFARIEKKFDAHLIIQNPELKKCRITADFTDQPLTRTFEMLGEVLDLNSKIEGRTVTITGQGCKPH